MGREHDEAVVPETPQSSTTALGEAGLVCRTARTGKDGSSVQGSSAASLEAVNTYGRSQESDEKGSLEDTSVTVSEIHRHLPDRYGHEGPIEYQALTLLSVVIPLYWGLWQLLGCFALAGWVSQHEPGPVLANGINPWWLGIFDGVSAFNNSGMSLLDANMIPFQNATLMMNSNSCSFRRLLRDSDRRRQHRFADPVCRHDVHLCLPSGNCYETFQCSGTTVTGCLQHE
jgi:hypothetical protein